MRTSPRKRGYTTKWDIASRAYRLKNPLCAMCLAKGKHSLSTHTNHIIPHKGDMTLFWDSANWQSLCTHCHNSTKQHIEKRGYSNEIGIDGWPIDHKHPANRRRGGG